MASQATPQVYGQASHDPAAELQRQMASAAAQSAAEQGARVAGEKAKHGFYEVKAYIVENPSSVKTLCFLIGLILMIFSILGVINPFGAFSRPGEYLANIYNVFFGVIICICDGKEDWMRACGDVQTKLFQRAFFLATPTGKAFFYFYVGSMTILMLPEGIWSVIYIILGSCLSLLALVMLFFQYCGGYCGSGYGQMAAGGVIWTALRSSTGSGHLLRSHQVTP
ncbi:unnamed protein product [Durusdinium trenchii]|uniref:Vesicle transport protein n=1 Tax=Durusdinium trenchii TaxID=1381693 RepID=A0ABP0LYI8_9DINO